MFDPIKASKEIKDSYIDYTPTDAMGSEVFRQPLLHLLIHIKDSSAK